MWVLYADLIENPNLRGLYNRYRKLLPQVLNTIDYILIVRRYPADVTQQVGTNVEYEFKLI
jgi:hypothetical protein